MSTRSAWLVLEDGRTLPLDDYTAGYAMTALSIGFPDVRDVTNNRPWQHGTDDQTRFFGGRAVTANITAWPGGKVPLDDIPALFGPYMNPVARPELHYRTLSGSEVERVITLRPSGFESPMPSPGKREIQAAWVAPDPLIRDAVEKSGIAYSGSSSPPGRGYDLQYQRVYPPGSGSPTIAELVTNGDIAVPPRLLIYGPITKPLVQIHSQSGSTSRLGSIAFVASFTISAGQWVEVDCRTHEAYLNSDPSQPVLEQVDFSSLAWPYILPAPYVNSLSLSGDSTSGITQVQAFWQDLYLS
jgi:hypothetical protein